MVFAVQTLTFGFPIGKASRADLSMTGQHGSITVEFTRTVSKRTVSALKFIGPLATNSSDH